MYYLDRKCQALRKGTNFSNFAEQSGERWNACERTNQR
jgi:hypothetical protein